jgi:acetylornithine deacetylase/succinyl-diaminopimelate desuccinylase-like protein
MTYSPLERRRRTLARVSLYASLAVSFTLLMVMLGHLGKPFDIGRSQDWIDTDYASLPEVQLLQQYVRIDTTPTTGDELAGARFLARQLAAVGIEAHIEPLGKGRANLWAIVEGEDPGALVLHHHIDVEPIHHPEHWRSHEPFSAEIDPPWIFGRGVFDMKSVAIAQLAALLDLQADLRASGERPRRTVVYLATSSEETGSDLGTRWVLAQHPELVERFWGVLTEGGWLEMRNVEDLKYWGVEFAQKRYVDILLCSDRRQRLADLREDLREVGFPKTAQRVTDEVRTFLKAYAPTRDDIELRRALERPDRLLDDPAAFGELPYYVRSLFRNEAVPFEVEEAEGGGYQLLVKLHLLPGADPEQVRRELLPDWLLEGVEVRTVEPDPPHAGSPLDHPIFEQAVAVLEENFPGTPVGPLLQPWTASDARFFRAAGIPSYGFSPFVIYTSDTIHVGGPEERLSLPGYVEGVKLYKELVRRLAGPS